jgi:type IV pilus assembly protein PilZ
MAPVLDQSAAPVNRPPPEFRSLASGVDRRAGDLDFTGITALHSRWFSVAHKSAEEFTVDESQDSDRRDFPRAPIELKVEYRRLNTFFADYTRNISRGGTFVKTQKPLDVGTEFLFKLVVPTLDNPIVLRGRVQWTVQTESANAEEPPGMGIKFIYDSDSQRREVENRVERLMIDSLGKHLYQKLVGRSYPPPSN